MDISEKTQLQHFCKKKIYCNSLNRYERRLHFTYYLVCIKPFLGHGPLSNINSSHDPNELDCCELSHLEYVKNNFLDFNLF